MTVGALAGGSGCRAPDDAEPTPAAVPKALLESLMPDTVRSSQVAAGVWHHYLWAATGPFAIHLIEVDLSRCELGLDVVGAGHGPDPAATHERVSDLATHHSRTVLAAVNGDFFTPEGQALGSEVRQGEARQSRPRPALAWRDGEPPLIGVFEVRDGVVSPPGWSTGGGRPEVDVMGGFPELLEAGARVGDLGVSTNPGFAASRHPRTAVGLDPVRSRLWLVVVDGRQGAYSTGMSLPELAELMEGLGVREALNLDGGGSTVMIVQGRQVSRPSDETGERAVVNALLLVEDSSACRRAPRF